jgi:hypothetical protein
MTLNKLLNELSATVTATGVNIGERGVPGNTRYTPEQIANAIRFKLVSSGTKITQPLTVKSVGGNKYSVIGQGLNLVATFDNASGKVDLFQAQQQQQPQMKPQQQVQQPQQQQQVQQPQQQMR